MANTGRAADAAEQMAFDPIPQKSLIEAIKTRVLSVWGLSFAMLFGVVATIGVIAAIIFAIPQASKEWPEFIKLHQPLAAQTQAPNNATNHKQNPHASTATVKCPEPRSHKSSKPCRSK